MTHIDLRSVKEILESKLRETTQAPSWRDSITIEPSADPVDASQQTLEREMETRKLDRHAAMIREIRAALARVQSGDYAICMQCEEAIPAKRLVAVPWVSLCIHCQEEADGEVNQNGDRGLSIGRLATAA